MWALGVVEDEPIGEFLVEGGQVGKEEIFVEVDEGLLEGAVEAFEVGVHPGRLGVGIPARDAAFLQGSGKVCLELAAIVREQDLRGFGQQAQGRAKRRLGVAAALGFARPTQRPDGWSGQ